MEFDLAEMIDAVQWCQFCFALQSVLKLMLANRVWGN